MQEKLEKTNLLTCVENSSGTTVRTSKSSVKFPRNNEIISGTGVFHCAGIEWITTEAMATHNLVWTIRKPL